MLTEIRDACCRQIYTLRNIQRRNQNPSASQHSQITTNMEPFRYLPTPIQVGVILHMDRASTPFALLSYSHIQDLFLCPGKQISIPVFNHFTRMYLTIPIETDI